LTVGGIPQSFTLAPDDFVALFTFSARAPSAKRKRRAQIFFRNFLGMPKRTDIKKILLIGSGPIVIGQACEFDYSGTQACKALREEGYTVVLVNSNPATIMTDPEMADRTYVEPITWQVVARIIEKERPDALLPTLGGQTGLNTAMDLYKHGVLEKFGVEMIGARADVIDKAEDRQKFKEAVLRIGLDVPKSGVARSLADAQRIRAQIGLPCVLRPSFTMGGSGGGIAYNKEEFVELIGRGLELSPVGEVLIEESAIGWKEYELEVMRDCADNVVIVCSIENLDPMGVHTGDSITVAPVQTLTDKEYQRMRDAALAIIREIGVETGGSNIQFAVNPDDGRMIVIEMNPRVSRSSALASKATGFPIAKIAAKLAVGYRLDELKNDITRETPACFEPTIDYVVTKIPRWAFEKFPDADPTLTTQMKSVGETMAIGRTFKESLQKALRGLETGAFGLGCDKKDLWYVGERPSVDTILNRLATPNAERIWYVRYAMKAGLGIDEIYRRTKIDRWFLCQIEDIVAMEDRLRACPGLHAADAELLWDAKQCGFSDRQLATIWNTNDPEVRRARQAHGVVPVFKLVDTCAAEFEAYTPYYYSTYERASVSIKSEIRNPKSETNSKEEIPKAENGEANADPVSDIGISDLGFVSDCGLRISDLGAEDETRPAVPGKDRIMILGGGPNRIGQGIEFDYCCCQAAFALREAGFETVMVNSNPETVSTDYETCDQLFFEPLTAEDVLNICDRVKPKGIIVQFGGQTPLNLARALEAAGAPIIGTSPESIDIAEDRERFQEFVDRLQLKQPANRIARDLQGAIHAARQIGYPVLVRPSFVLGGRAMEIVYDESRMTAFVNAALEASQGKPILIDQFLESAVEVDVDCLCDGTRAVIGGVMQHIEEAGVHSGDSACVIPPYSLPPEVIAEIKRQTRELALALNVKGLMNVQFAVAGLKPRDERSESRGSPPVVYVLEVNPRASRTVPFVAKACNVPLARLAALIMAGKTLDELGVHAEIVPKHFSVKESVFPFNKFPGVDIILGPEMRSTGEVMGIADTFPMAFAKSQMAASSPLPMEGAVFISVADRDKPEAVRIARALAEMGYRLLSTRGTARVLREADIPVDEIPKLQEGRPNLVDLMKNGQVVLVINTPSGKGSRTDEGKIRAAAVTHRVTSITTLAAALAAVEACRALRQGELTVKPLQDWFASAEHIAPSQR
jgi:carbamoyl-phosphate synthase large subunit